MKNKLIGLFLAITFLFTIAGCTGSEKPVITVIADEEVPFQPAKNLNVEIYIDKTPSMSGFATKDASGSYVSLIKDISSSASSLSGVLGTVTYFSFGENITPITQQQYNSAVMQSFYVNNAMNRKTMVASVLKKISGEFGKSVQGGKDSKVSVIVTDLFENNSNVDPLINNIKDSFVKSNLSIGVLGIKSFFKGKVYDIGRDQSGKPYESKPGVLQSYRPFYVLILGKPADVLNFKKSLDKLSLKELPESVHYFEIFNSYSQLKLATLSKTEMMRGDGKTPRIKIDESTNTQITDDRTVALKAFNSNQAKDSEEHIISYFDMYPIEGARLDYAIKTRRNILHNMTDKLFSSNVRIEKLSDKTYIPDNDAQLSVRAFKVESEQDKIKTDLTMNLSSLKPGTYRIAIEVNYDADLLTPVIPFEWNMKDENDPLYGRKTIYLYNILEGLYGLSRETTKPIIKAYYYFRNIK